MKSFYECLQTAVISIDPLDPIGDAVLSYHALICMSLYQFDIIQGSESPICPFPVGAECGMRSNLLTEYFFNAS